MNIRKKRLFYNTYSSFIYQLTAILCGFVLPRLILNSYDSAVNGLVNSITQFLQFITFLDLGVGSVVESTLYKPLADKDMTSVSQVMVSAFRFFRMLAIIMLVYIGGLCLVYPALIKDEFNVQYTVLLIAVMAISSFAQYYFGVVDKILLSADQKGYIYYNIQAVTLLINTGICALLMSRGASIHLVRLVTSVIYLIRPIALRLYVDKYYHINRKLKNITEPIGQKWNGVAQHISNVVLENTDVVVLTIFDSLKNVSIYSVYYLVVNGVKTLLLAVTSGIKALIGELWARQEIDELKSFFTMYEWGFHTFVVYVFSCMGVLIVPFICVYTNGVNDVAYANQGFAYLIVAANALHCLRIPYSTMILAAGHYKQTQGSYICSAILNCVISIILVVKFGLIGVSVGTLFSMLYQTVWMVKYNVDNLIQLNLMRIFKQFFVDLITVCLIILITDFIHLEMLSFLYWILMALKVLITVLIICVVINWMFYREKIIKLFIIIGNRIYKN